MSKLQPVRGTHDILPKEARARRAIAERLRGVAECYGFGEIQPPIFEFSEVFLRTLGDTSDVVTKETYTFTDRGGESITLRPEFTASVVRAFLSEGLQQELPLKLFYHGPAFRYERPQKGRLRQFHQFGVELLGVAEPEADIEVIAMAWQCLEALGLSDQVTLEINSLGDAESRANMRALLVEHFTKHKSDLSEDSVARLDRNPLRILDSKDKRDQVISEDIIQKLAGLGFYTEPAQRFFDTVKSGLTALGIPYTISPKLVRGLDYYSHTVFEFTTERLGAQNTVLAGGRYDGLVEIMGGPATPGVGWASGMERLLALCEESGTLKVPQPDVIAVVPVGETAESAAWQLALALRAQGFTADIAYRGNVKKRMQRADKIGASKALMLGEDELKNGEVAVKNLATGEQKTVKRAELAAHLS